MFYCSVHLGLTLCMYLCVCIGIYLQIAHQLMDQLKSCLKLRVYLVFRHYLLTILVNLMLLIRARYC